MKRYWLISFYYTYNDGRSTCCNTATERSPVEWLILVNSIFEDGRVTLSFALEITEEEFVKLKKADLWLRNPIGLL